jgi:MoaA/NifB/PqqE/SkfB family radical SAM enzyme
MGWLETYETSTLRLEASTICQLACPSCATTHGVIKKQIGAGFLAFDDFRRIVDENPWVWEIELSNWGEIFLNPDIERIIAYAYRRSVALTACNGANLNHVRESVLEAMVRYKFRAITCSIDGVTQGTYETYRRRGNIDRVLANIRRLNHYKQRWKSEYPLLGWQMVAFGHNEHEIAEAQALARELGMGFTLKVNCDPEFSPVRQPDAVRQTVARTRLGTEELPGEGDEYLTDDYCSQLWRQPQINFDGTLLGCCQNVWGSFGENALTAGVKHALGAERMRYAKAMLQGAVPPRDDVPCTTCAIYRNRAGAGRWLCPPPPEPGLRGFLRRRGLGRVMVWAVNRRGRWLRPSVAREPMEAPAPRG